MTTTMKIAAPLIIAASLLSAAPSSADTVKMSMQEARGLFTALAALDGYDKAVKDGATEKVIKAAYAFGGGVRLAVGRNLAALSPTVQAYDKAQRELFVQLAGGKEELKGESLLHFQTDTQKMLDQPVSVDLVILKPSELKLDPPDNNPIPGSVISGLQPMLKE